MSSSLCYAHLSNGISRGRGGVGGKEEFERIAACGAFAKDEGCRRMETERKRGEDFEVLSAEVASVVF